MSSVIREQSICKFSVVVHKEINEPEGDNVTGTENTGTYPYE
jgi:hypothetical protein